MSFLIAFPTLRIPQEFDFFTNLCELVVRSGYELDVLVADNQDALLLRSFPIVNVVQAEPGLNADDLLRRLGRIPEKALLNNDLLPLRFQLRALLKKSGVSTRIFERSPLADFTWVEDDIFFGGSEFFSLTPERLSQKKISGLARELLASLSNDVVAARHYEVENALRQQAASEVRSRARPYLLFLLDATKLTGWGDQWLGSPWSRLYPQFSDPAEALGIFSAFASVKGLDLLVRTHPSDPKPRFIPDLEAFQLAKESLGSVIAGAQGVVSGVSKTLWSVAALGKPFASLGLNPISGLLGGSTETPDANAVLARLAEDLERGQSIEMNALGNALDFANEAVWVRHDFSNPAASRLTDWVAEGQPKGRSSVTVGDAWAEFSKEDHVTVNETEVALEWVKFQWDTAQGEVLEPAPLVYVDVGAHNGDGTKKARLLGYRVVAFEPNPKMAEKFQKTHGDDEGVVFSRAALAAGPEAIRSFYTSIVSSGISTLEPFHESHTASHRVFTSSLRAFLPKWQVDYVDVLKVDTEGFDLFVLQGHDWDTVKPRVVVAEFEDAKTESLGYRVDDLAHFLIDRGYSVFVSEWFPIEKYGGGHLWRKVYPYGTQVIPVSSWGNLIAVHGEVRSPDFKLHFYRFLKKSGQKPKGSEARDVNAYRYLTKLARNNFPVLYQFLRGYLLRARSLRKRESQ